MALKPLLTYGSISGALEDQYAIAEQRRKQETENQIKDTEISEKAVRDSTAVAEQSMQSADVTRQKQLDILGGIDNELKKANRAIELGNSDNPLDRLTLWAMQQADPSYTRDGNIRRIEYFQKAAEAVGGIEAIKQGGYADQLKSIENLKNLALMDNDSELAMATLMEQQGQQRIDAIGTYLSTLSGDLQNQNAIQDQALSNVPDEAVDAAIQDAQKSPTKTANVGGIDISLARLQQRQLAIADRKYQLTTRNELLATNSLDKMTPEEVQKAEEQAAANNGIYTTDDGVSIPFQKLRERRAANLNMDFAQATQAEGLRGIDEGRRREVDKRLLDTYSTTELSSMLAGDGSDPKTKTRFDKDQIVTALTQKQAAVDEQFNMDYLEKTGQLTALPAKQNIDYMDSLNVTPGSPLAQTIATQRSVNLTIAGVMGDASADPRHKVDMLAAAQASRQAVDTAIQQEAIRLAGPTADKDIVALNEAVIRRQPLAPDVVEQIITERAIDPKKGLGGILNQEMNGIFTAAYGQKMDQLRNPADPANMGLSLKEKQMQAAQYATQVLTDSASGGLTETMLGAQTQVYGNPLGKAGISGAQFLTLSKKSDEAGIKQLLDSGQVPKGTTAEQLRAQPTAELVAMQQAHLMVELEKIKPGLAKSYTDWWTSPEAKKYTDAFVASENSKKNKVSDMMTWSLIAPNIPNQMDAYSRLALQGREIMTSDVVAKQNQEYMTFGGSVESKQAYLIDATPKMSDQDKKIAWTILQPLIQTTKEQGLNSDQANQYIEGKLATLTAPSGDPARVLKMMQQGRGEALGTITRFMKANPAFNGSVLGLPGPYSFGAKAPVDYQVGGFEWLKQVQ